MEYLLSATEVVMPGTYLMLNQLVEELPSIDGVVCYSLFQLPEEEAIRWKIFERVLEEKRSIHFAVETLCGFEKQDFLRLNNIFRVKSILAFCPLKEDISRIVHLFDDPM